MTFRYARHPHNLGAEHPKIIEGLLELAASHQYEALSAIIHMLADFHQHGLDCRYVKKLHGTPVWELKTQSRGGVKGGARVYFYMLETGEAVLVNVEIKQGDTPSNVKLKEVLQIIQADRQGIKVW